MLPLQCMTAEEKDRCLFYAYPEQHIHHQLMFSEHAHLCMRWCYAHLSAVLGSSAHQSQGL